MQTAALRKALLMIALMSSVGAQQMSLYVDFGNSRLQTRGADFLGHYWNNVTEAQSTGLQNLVSDDDVSTGISLGLGGAVSFNPWGVIEPGGTSRPAGAFLGGLAVASATRDWMVVTGNQILTVTLSNLSLDGVYRLSLFGSRDSTQRQVTEFSVAGLTSSTQFLQTGATGVGLSPQANANRDKLSVFANLAPNAGRNLVISIKRHEGDAAYLGALKLELMNSANFSPAALHVRAAGAGRVGSAVVGRYNFLDRESDPEGASGYVWERASFPTAAPIELLGDGLATPTYLPSSSDIGSYIRFGVIPRALTGCAQGSIVYSKWIEPILGSSTFSSYHIGSSYTQWANMPMQLKNLAASRGIPMITGWQVTSGKNTRYHWENGLNGTIGAGTFSRNELSSGSWDAVVLQPYNTEWQPLQFDQALDYASRFYSLADANGAQFYLYAAWPSRSQNLFIQTNINDAFETLRSKISSRGNKAALIIPAGEAFRAIIQEASNGYLKSFNANHSLDRENLYLDDLHQSNLGAYVSALTHYATVMKSTPVGLPATALDANFYNDSSVAFAPELATRIQEIVWWVVANYPHSGVAESVSKPVDFSVTTAPSRPGNYSPLPANVAHPEGANDSALLRLAFGTSLDEATVPPQNLPHLTSGSTPQQIEIEYTINPDAEAAMVTFTPEWSVDLIHWTQTPPPSTLTTRNGQHVRFSWPVTLQREFFRVYLEKPAP